MGIVNRYREAFRSLGGMLLCGAAFAVGWTQLHPSAAEAPAVTTLRLLGTESLLPELTAAARPWITRHTIELDARPANSTVALANLLVGETDMAVTDRPLTRDEARRASELRLNVEATVVSYNGAVVVAHPNVGRALQQLDFRSLRTIFGSELPCDWRQLSPALSGPIRVIVPSNHFGMTQSFYRTLGLSTELPVHVEAKEDLASIPVQVSRDPTAIAIVPASFPRDGLATFAIVDDAGKVFRCTPESMRLAVYPFTQPQWVVTAGNPSDASRQLVRFLQSSLGQQYLENAGSVSIWGIDWDLTPSPSDQPTDSSSPSMPNDESRT